MASPFVGFVFEVFLLFSSGSLTDASIRISVEVEKDTLALIGPAERRDLLSYQVVNEFNETLFRGGDLAVFTDGQWCVAPSGHPRSQSFRLPSVELVISKQETINGATPGLGSYDGIRIEWFCDLSGSGEPGYKCTTEDDCHRAGPNTYRPIITSFLNFHSQRAVVFDLEFPHGLENTSLALFDSDATLATFPFFVMTSSSSSSSSGKSIESLVSTRGGGSDKTGNDDNNESLLDRAKQKDIYFPPTLPSALSWEGSFVQGVRRLSVGPRGGPTVFYNASDASLKNVVVASPFFPSINNNNGLQNDSNPHLRHHFNQFTAGNNKDWTGTTSAFSPGLSGRLKTIRAGVTQSILLYEGSGGGITATMEEWGTMMQTASSLNLSSNSTSILSTLGSSRLASDNAERNIKDKKIKDVTLEKIGYQTDNGAMYCFCRQSNCSEVLFQEKEHLDSIGIPIGYLSFQGAGTSSGREKAAPWCIERWSADGGQDKNEYPLDTGTFQKALGVPLQLYAPYFCPNSTKYFKPHTSWKSVLSNPKLPGCKDFAFETMDPTDSKEFFTWFMKKGTEKAGMASFETDFMNQNVNCVDKFVEDSFGADEFLAGMAGAALELNTPIQWCYASPNVLFSSLNFPAVTNFRVSFDYCYGYSYEIGESSLLNWALGAAPSKDTLWTTENNRTETPGCEWIVDHEAAAAELHVVLAIMSTG